MNVWMSVTYAVLFCAAAGDVRDRKIDRSTILLLLLLGLFRPDRDLTELEQSAVLAAAAFPVLLLLWYITKGRAFGGGDVRLVFSEIFILREGELIAALVFSAVMLSAYFMNIRLKQKESRLVPAAAFLCPGMMLSLFVAEIVTGCPKM